MPAGYSATPTARKLGIKEGSVLALIDAPRGWSIEGLPDRVTVRDTLRGSPDVVVAFVPSLRDRRRRLPSLVRGLPAASALWLAWPRKAAGHESDVTENALRDLLLPTGLVDVKVAAIGHDWSGLKFVWRKERREERRRAGRSAGGTP